MRKMIFRVSDDYKLYHIPLDDNSISEDDFIQLQNNPSFIKVKEEDLDSLSINDYEIDKELIKYLINIETNKIEIDIQRTVNETIPQILDSIITDYLSYLLSSLDWGKTYEEALSELQNSLISLENTLLYILKKYDKNITITEIRDSYIQYMLGHISFDDIKNKLIEKGLTNTDINRYIKLLEQIDEVARLIYFVEEVWNYEEEFLDDLSKSKTVEELKQKLSRFKLPEFNY